MQKAQNDKDPVCRDMVDTTEYLPSDLHEVFEAWENVRDRLLTAMPRSQMLEQMDHAIGFSPEYATLPIDQEWAAYQTTLFRLKGVRDARVKEIEDKKKRKLAHDRRRGQKRVRLSLSHGVTVDRINEGRELNHLSAESE